MSKIAMTKITVQPKNAPKPVAIAFTSWADADKFISTFEGGATVVLTFADGSSYAVYYDDGNIDIEQTERRSLRDYVTSILSFSAGLLRPNWMRDWDWGQHLERIERVRIPYGSIKDISIAWLDNYDIAPSALKEAA